MVGAASRDPEQVQPQAQASVAIFAPNPLLTVTLEAEGSDRQSIHFHAGGQAVWVARMVACLGARPMLCGFLGGETGELLLPLLERVDRRRRRAPGGDHERQWLLRHRPSLGPARSCWR